MRVRLSHVATFGAAAMMRPALLFLRLFPRRGISHA